MATVEQVDDLESKAVAALLRWVDENRVVNDAGEPMRWANGRPVALDVLEVLAAIRRHTV